MSAETSTQAASTNGAVATRPASAEQRRPGQERYQVSIDEYVRFHEQGFLIVRGLVSRSEVHDLLDHTEELMDGKITVPGHQPPAPHLSRAEKAQHYLRIHMLHRVLEIHERFLLHPRVLDVLEALIGPDVLAMQTMLFLKAPGKPGQGYHQDSYYIPTHPDTLCGAWLALDRADEENGCVWMTVGSQHEPVYPPSPRLMGQWKKDSEYSGNHRLTGMLTVDNPSHDDTEINELGRIAAKYPGREAPAVVEPGDVVFFGGHVLHRSHANRSKDRFRRAFVGHYCNARSYTVWGGGSNEAHILARGDTHLPFAQPKFGTPCAAALPPEERRHSSPIGASMMGGADGMMQMAPHGKEEKHGY